MSTRLIELSLRRTIGEANIDMTLAVPREHVGAGVLLPFEIWFYSNDGANPFLVVNPSIQVEAYRRTGPSGRAGAALRLPVSSGGLLRTGGLAQREAVIWKPFVPLTTEVILALDRMRSHDYGIHVEFGLNAAVLRFQRHRNVEEPLATTHSGSLPWHAGFDITPDIWRELTTAWGWPRPRVFELNPRSFASLDDFEMSVRSLEAAERFLATGDWAEAISKARSVVEAVLRHLGVKERQATHWRRMSGAGLPSEMQQLLKTFSSVTSLEHHPTGNSEAWQRADARFLVQLAASLAEYAATLACCDLEES